MEVITDKSVFDYVTLGVAKIFGDTSLAAYRNVKVDGPIRMEQAKLEISQKAKDSNIDLEVWRPK